MITYISFLPVQPYFLLFIDYSGSFLDKVFTSIPYKHQLNLEMAHKVFRIPEILELILLHTETRTLLLSQRVCRLWLSLISHTPSLQIALFFKPSKIPISSDQKRTRNPLFGDTLWPEFLRKQLPTAPRWYKCCYRLDFPVLDLAREQAYLRPEASWRRMLFQQPPSSCIGIVEYNAEGASDLYSHIRIFNPKGKADEDENCFLRMSDLVSPLDSGALVPGQDKWVFWYEPSHLTRLEREHRHERARVTSTYLNDCDFVVCTMYCDYLRPWYKASRGNRLTFWLRSLDKSWCHRSLPGIWAYDLDESFSID